MKKIYLTAILASLLFGSCSNNIDNEEANLAQSKLSIGLPIGINRTTVDDSGRASWCDGDSFLLWAENRTGGFNISGAEFAMMYYWHSEQSAVFTSNTNSLADGKYTYYAVSPTPESVNRNTVTYTIPATQQGESFNGAYDIMVATPLNAEALSAEKVNNLALEFNHKMHNLKVTIAENNLGVAIKQLQFSFPTAVVGTVTLDAVSGNATFSNGTKNLNISVTEGVNVGDNFWATIFPTNIAGQVKVTAVGVDGRLSVEKSISLSKECLEGHITPLALTIPTERTTLRFSIGKNNLGENIERLTITDNTGESVSFVANAQNTYDFSVNSADANAFDHYEGKTFTATFESANAIVKRTFTMPQNLTSGVNIIPAIEVPYLFFEDFSSIHTSFEKDDKRVDNLRSANGMLLNSYMSISGWNGAHIKGVAGKSVRVNTRHQSFMGATRTNGRLDSPAMKNLKAGANVKLVVTFDMGAYANSGYSGSNDIFCMAGSHTASESSVLNGLEKTTVAGEDIHDNERVPGMFTSLWLTTGYLPQNCNNDSFGSTFPTYSFTASGCSSATRFCFVPCCVQQNWGSGNAHYYIYIDNIRVSIAQ
ncbi:MAG: fimbrillin family protein [Alistipes sp.]|nr:fimbrillin family protein [Alistipes sp.]